MGSCHLTCNFMLSDNSGIHYHLGFLNLLLSCQSPIRLEPTLLLRRLLSLIHRSVSCWPIAHWLRRHRLLFLIWSFRRSDTIRFDLLTRIVSRLWCRTIKWILSLWLSDTLCDLVFKRVPIPLPLIFLDQIVFLLRWLRELLELLINPLDHLHSLCHFLLQMSSLLLLLVAVLWGLTGIWGFSRFWTLSMLDLLRELGSSNVFSH
jgi:hypothetical protein